jgi:hypothetical protein
MVVNFRPFPKTPVCHGRGFVFSEGLRSEKINKNSSSICTVIRFDYIAPSPAPILTAKTNHERLLSAPRLRHPDLRGKWMASGW